MIYLLCMFLLLFFFFFKQKTAYEMSIGDWSSDVCSSDLGGLDEEAYAHPGDGRRERPRARHRARPAAVRDGIGADDDGARGRRPGPDAASAAAERESHRRAGGAGAEDHGRSARADACARA